MSSQYALFVNSSQMRLNGADLITRSILIGMAHYTAITIIYNPHSTGPSHALARQLRVKLANVLPHPTISLTATKYAGHAEELAYALAMASKKPLIISSSGDGGYHEIVNGLLRAQADGAKPIAGLLPAGNANDHHKHMHQNDIVDEIVKNHIRRIDVLKLTTIHNGQPLERFAHSYIGVGFTPEAGQELTKAKLNHFREAWIVTKALLQLQPVRIQVRGKVRTFDSLIFSNVSKMSKILSLSNSAELTDGKFEVNAFHRHSKIKFIASLIKASTRGLVGDLQTDHFSFTTLKQTLVQLDGEVMTIDAGAKVIVTIEPLALRCIV